MFWGEGSGLCLNVVFDMPACRTQSLVDRRGRMLIVPYGGQGLEARTFSSAAGAETDSPRGVFSCIAGGGLTAAVSGGLRVFPPRIKERALRGQKFPDEVQRLFSHGRVLLHAKLEPVL